MPIPQSDPQTINLTSGAVRYTLPAFMTEISGKDVTGAACTAGLSTSEKLAPASGQMLVPPILTYPTISALAYRRLGGFVPRSIPDNTILHQIMMRLLIGGSGLHPTVNGDGTPTSYFLWMRPTDTPEVVPVMMLKLILI